MVAKTSHFGERAEKSAFCVMLSLSLSYYIAVARVEKRSGEDEHSHRFRFILFPTSCFVSFSVFL